MLPDEASDTGIFGNCRERSVRFTIVRVRTFDWYVVDKRNGYVRDFGLQDMSNVLVEYRYRVGPSHRQSDQTQSSIRRLGCSIIAGAVGKRALIACYID